MNRRSLVAAVFVLAWWGPQPANAERVSIDAALHAADKPYIQATGEATVSAKPDQAFIEIGVVTQGASVEAVASKNAVQTGAVLSELRELLGTRAQIKTTRYYVRPNYHFEKPGAAMTIKGYLATNVVEVTLSDLTQVGKVIDSATRSGANNIQGIQYGLKAPREVRAKALREAAEQARANVEAIASGLGLRVIRVLSAEETTSGDGFAMRKKAPPPPPPGTAPSTPIEIGMIDVGANVTLRVETGQ